MKMVYTLLIGCLLAAGAAAEQVFPSPDWQDAPDPIASPDAYRGGEVKMFLGQSPKSLNYYLENSSLAAEVFGLMYESLLSTHPITLDYEPWLASQWRIADDKRTFTFVLDERAKWSDGQPITAEDVRWTYNTIMDEKNLTGPHKVSLETFEPPEVVDARTIRFTAKEVHWRNLGAAGGFQILPKHVWENQDFNKINFEFPVVSGPYRLTELKDGISVRMQRRNDWWAGKLKRTQGTYNFDSLLLKFFGERDNAYEAFKKGDIDVFPVYTAHRWVTQTAGEKFDKYWIVKQKVMNYDPVGFQGWAMNMRRPLFEDVRVREAIAHLINREKMNATLMHNQYFLHRSYYEDLYSKQHPLDRQPVSFDKAAARRLLADAGWKANPETGLLEKDGRVFHIKFLTRSATSDKFLAIFKEDLRDVGIDLSIDKKDWAAWAKDMDEFNYDMTWAAWGAGVRKDPEGMWHSKEALRQAGSNITGFMDQRVDALIEQQKTIFDIEARHEIVRQIDQIIFDQHPYALLWNINFTRLLYWHKFGTPRTVLSKYSNESAVIPYWWIDEDSAADLADAQAANEALPRPPSEIKFDDVFEAD